MVRAEISRVSTRSIRVTPVFLAIASYTSLSFLLKALEFTSPFTSPLRIVALSIKALSVYCGAGSPAFYSHFAACL